MLIQLKVHVYFVNITSASGSAEVGGVCFRSTGVDVTHKNRKEQSTVSRRSIARWVISVKSEKKVAKTSYCGNYNLKTLGLPGGSQNHVGLLLCNWATLSVLHYHLLGFPTYFP